MFHSAYHSWFHCPDHLRNEILSKCPFGAFLDIQLDIIIFIITCFGLIKFVEQQLNFSVHNSHLGFRLIDVTVVEGLKEKFT